MNTFIREKKHRLAKENYLGQISAAITIIVHERKPLFVKDEIYELFESMLLEELKVFSCNADIYLFMSDHCHLLLRGKSDSADMLKMIKIFKQKSGFWLSQNQPNFKWQKDFYDHILRKDEDISKQINYILQNPVKKGLVKSWKDYHYKGSTVYNLNEWSYDNLF